MVTGASSGIGAALSARLAQEGARVAGTGRDTAALAGAGHFAATWTMDLTAPGAPEHVVNEAAQALDGLDLVVNNAGAGWSGPFSGMPAHELDLMVDINLRAAMHVSRVAGPYLLDSSAGGHLVLVGSVAGLMGVADEVAYGAAKAGVRGLADGLRAEWARPAPRSDGTLGTISVSLVSPGPTATAFFDRRNQPYQRRWPRPLPVDQVVQVIMDVIQNRRPEAVVPRWLAVPARLRGGLPGIYRKLEKAQDRLPH